VVVSALGRGDEVADGDGLVAMRAWSSRAQPPAEDAALVAPLLAQEAHLALGALVDDGGLR